MTDLATKTGTDTDCQNSMLSRFEGEIGQRRVADVLKRAAITGGDRQLAEELAKSGSLVLIETGAHLISEGAADTDLYIVLSGSVGVDVKGVRVNHRQAGDHVGEIAVADPSQPRSADVVGVKPGVALQISEPTLSEIAEQYPDIWRRLFVEANQRLIQRNALVRPANNQPNVFIICSVEALHVAQSIQAALGHDDMLVTLWTDGVFRASEYPLKSLTAAVSASDFAVAIIHGDDVVMSRESEQLAPRDNVTFELGLFMGELGQERSILVEPRDAKIKLASDLRGLTTLTYREGATDHLEPLLAPTVHALRQHIHRIGVR